jgi:hypothetical protein
MHQISRSENARVAHPVLDMHFSVAENVELAAVHRKYSIIVACPDSAVADEAADYVDAILPDQSDPAKEGEFYLKLFTNRQGSDE